MDEMLHQRCFANAGLTTQQPNPTGAVPKLVEGGAQRVQLLCAFEQFHTNLPHLWPCAVGHTALYLSDKKLECFSYQGEAIYRSDTLHWLLLGIKYRIHEHRKAWEQG